MTGLKLQDIAGEGLREHLDYVPQIDRLCLALFVLVVAVLGVEYVQLPLGLSLYKVVIVPACSLGIILLWFRGVRISSIFAIIPLLVFVPLMVLSYLKWGVASSLISAVGLIPFYIFMHFYLVNFGWPLNASIALAVWSIPHLVSLVLFRLGLSNEAYTDSVFRFDGIHSDPNFMVLFVLASATGKAVVMRVASSVWIRRLLFALVVSDIFMIGLSGSRGGALGLIMTLFTFVALRKGIKKSFFLFLFLAIFLNTSFNFVYRNLPENIAFSPFWVTVDRFIYSDRLGDINSSSGDRLYLWGNARRMIKEKGVMVGYSVENFRKKYYLYPHNTFVDAALECGLPGLILLLGILIFSAKTLLRNILRLDIGGVQALLLGVAFWGTLIFLSSFTTKVFWLSIIVPYSMSVRLILNKSASNKSWRLYG